MKASEYPFHNQPKFNGRTVYLPPVKLSWWQRLIKFLNNP